MGTVKRARRLVGPALLLTTLSSMTRIAGAEPLPIPRPYNADGLPLPLSAGDGTSEAASARRLSHRPTAGWKESVQAMVELVTWPTDDALGLLDRYPGVVWQSVRPDIRPWLLLVGSLPADRLDALLDGERQTVSLEAAPAELATLLHTEGGIPEDAGILIHLDVLWQLNPFPVRIIRGRILQDGTWFDDAWFGVAERPARKIADARALRAWSRAAALYGRWGSGEAGRLRFHWSPELSGTEAEAIAEKVSEACEVAAAWHETDPAAACTLDLFLYALDEMPRYGLAKHQDYALPAQMQVHQQAGASRGHEVAHIVSEMAWGPSGNGFASEGIAMLLNQDFDPLKRARSHGVCDRRWGMLEGDWFDASPSAYFQGTVAIAWLDATAGRSAVKALYLAEDPAAVLSRYAGVPVPELQDVLCTWLASSHRDDAGGRGLGRD